MIKQFCLTLAILMFLGMSAFAQLSGNKLLGPNSKWKVKRVGITLGVDQDMIHALSHNYFTSLLDAETQAEYAGIDYRAADKYAGICENPHVRLNLSLVPSHLANTELNFALNGIFFRNDGVTYYNRDQKLGETDYLSFDNWGHEVNAEASIVKSKTILNTLRFFGGLGTNIGYTFGNYLEVNTSDYRTVLDYSLLETGQIVYPNADAFMAEDLESIYAYHQDHKINDGISQRVFAHAGISFLVMRKFELGVEGRLGYGYRYHFGRKATGARLQSIGLTAKWVLGEASPWLKEIF